MHNGFTFFRGDKSDFVGNLPAPTISWEGNSGGPLRAYASWAAPMPLRSEWGIWFFCFWARQTATTPRTLKDHEKSLSNLVTISQINDPNSKRGDGAVKAVVLLPQILNTRTCQRRNFGKTDLGRKNLCFSFARWNCVDNVRVCSDRLYFCFF